MGTIAMLQPFVTAAVLLTAGSRPLPPPGGTAPDSAEVVLAAARYTPVLYPGKRLAIESVVGGFIMPETEARWKPALHADLVTAAGAVGRSRDEAMPPFCLEVEAPGCVDRVVRFGPPVVTGDSATIWVYSRHRWRSPATPSDFRTSHHDVHLLAVRSAEGWRVVRVLEERVE